MAYTFTQTFKCMETVNVDDSKIQQSSIRGLFTVESHLFELQISEHVNCIK